MNIFTGDGRLFAIPKTDFVTVFIGFVKWVFIVKIFKPVPNFPCLIAVSG
jgi:hypothetical protein